MSARVTEAHRAITESVCELLDSEEMIGPSPVERAAQLIADSEARAVLNAAKSNWSESIGFIITERDQLRAELARLDTEKPWLKEANATVADLRAEVRAVLKIVNEQTARAESAEREVERLRDIGCVETLLRAERAESELAGIRALANRRNKSDHSQDTTHQLVVALDQALDIAQAELAAERARLDWLMAGGVCLVQHSGGFHVSRLHAQVSRAAIDSAMKEETK